MSHQLFIQDVLFYQRFLKANGYYKKKLDGLWGKYTDAADQTFIDESNAIAKKYGMFDARSERNINSLTPKAQVLARQFMNIVTQGGRDVRIISGTRTYAEQDALYRKGRWGNTENKVTNARGGRSNHNFGIAWDIGLFDNGKYITQGSKYKQVAALVVSELPDLEWGGDWQSFPDYPHYQQKAISDSVAVIRQSFENGKAYV